MKISSLSGKLVRSTTLKGNRGATFLPGLSHWIHAVTILKTVQKRTARLNYLLTPNISLDETLSNSWRRCWFDAQSCLSDRGVSAHFCMVPQDIDDIKFQMHLNLYNWKVYVSRRVCHFTFHSWRSHLYGKNCHICPRSRTETNLQSVQDSSHWVFYL